MAKLGVFCIPNTNYAQTEMFASAVLGLTFIRNKCDRVFFTPADVPLFTNTTLKKLLASKADVVKPVCRGWSGHPILLAGSLVDKVLTYKGPNGLRGAIKTYAKKVQVVEVEDEGVLPVAENRAQYDKLVTINNKLLFRPAVEVALLREDKLFDKDVALLLSMGFLKPCLCYEDGVDLRAILRSANQDVPTLLCQAIQTAIAAKPQGHCFNNQAKVTEEKNMNQIGG